MQPPGTSTIINIRKQRNYGLHRFVGIFVGIPWSDISMPQIELNRKNHFIACGEQLHLELVVEYWLKTYELNSNQTAIQRQCRTECVTKIYSL
jgi:hypothetical protein